MNTGAKFANTVLTIIAVLFMAMFFYVLSKSSLHPPGHMNRYYFVSVAGFLIFSHMLFRFSNDLKIKITLLILSLAISIYALEIIVSYYNPVRPEHNRAVYVKGLGFPFDSRTRYEVLTDMRKNGVDAYLYHNPTHHPEDHMAFVDKGISPYGFISGTTTIHCNEGGEYLIYKTDEHGFNNPEGLYDQAIDYVLIGDSFIKGSCVKREDNIAGNLLGKGRKVLNLGVGNTGPLSQLAILKEYARVVRPGIVFWFYYEGNDHEGLEVEKRSATFFKYLNSDFSQDLFNKQELIDKTLTEYYDAKLSTAGNKPPREEMSEEIGNGKGARFNLSAASLKLFQLRRRLGMVGIGECKCNVDPLLKDIFSEAKHTVDGWGGELVIVYLPEWSRYPEKVNICRKHFLSTGKEGVVSIVEGLGIPLIDIEKVFSSHPDPLSLFPFRIYGHYNEKGYSLVAHKIDSYISEFSTDTRRR